jgi:hypothetical protein
MPKLETDFPFQFRSYRQNEDIQLITTHNLPVVLQLVECFDLEDEIAKELEILLDPAAPEKKTVVVLLRKIFENGSGYAYTALLECDLCGIKNGFFAIFKSLSGDMETLSEECTNMFNFLNQDLQKQESLEEFLPRKELNGN